MTPLEMAQAALTDEKFQPRYDQLRALNADNDKKLKDAQEQLTAAQTLLANIDARENQIGEREKNVTQREKDAAAKDKWLVSQQASYDLDRSVLADQQMEFDHRKIAFNDWIKQAKALADQLP